MLTVLCYAVTHLIRVHLDQTSEDLEVSHCLKPSDEGRGSVGSRVCSIGTSSVGAVGSLSVDAGRQANSQGGKGGGELHRVVNEYRFG